ncbi:MAG: iron ABC transporter substrate-binding protein [Actinomycetota bacterium]|nr:iron ABC transporter substrate-binding protein [Actinomycetota bacterium]MDD5666134.1 iron ABC transporter substrate-binding protein [Actinomycetota bacterium]
MNVFRGADDAEGMTAGARITVMAVLCTMILAMLPLAGCGSKAADGQETRDVAVVTDLAGRRVEIDSPVERVVAIGPGALRLVCYVGAAEKVVGIERFEIQWDTGRPYMIAHPELLELPVIGQGGPDSTPDPEMLITVDPDVIFAAYLVDTAKANELQYKTGIPVVVLSYGRLGTFDEEVFESIDIVGEVTGDSERAGKVAGYIRGCLDDVEERTADIPEVDKPAVYAGGLGMKGTHGIESTQAEFPPLDAANALNVVDETGAGGSVIIDKEKLLHWDPEIIFVDEVGLQMVRDDYAGNPGLYNALKAVKEGRLYGYLPFNFYATNIDTALADTYFMGKAIFPHAFEDVDPVAKADEIYEFLVGKAVYERMAGDFGGFTEIKLAPD